MVTDNIKIWTLKEKLPRTGIFSLFANCSDVTTRWRDDVMWRDTAVTLWWRDDYMHGLESNCLTLFLKMGYPHHGMEFTRALIRSPLERGRTPTRTPPVLREKHEIVAIGDYHFHFFKFFSEVCVALLPDN